MYELQVQQAHEQLFTPHWLELRQLMEGKPDAVEAYVMEHADILWIEAPSMRTYSVEALKKLLSSCSLQTQARIQHLMNNTVLAPLS